MVEMQKTSPRKDGPRKGGKMKWVLGVSLALNLLCVGAITGAAFRYGGEGKHARGISVQNWGGPLARSLPKDARRALHRKLRAEGSGLPTRAERRVLYREMSDVLRAERFDAAAVNAIFATQVGTAQKIQGVAQEHWLALVADMSVAERTVVADRLEEILNRPRQKRKGKDAQQP